MLKYVSQSDMRCYLYDLKSQKIWEHTTKHKSGISVPGKTSFHNLHLCWTDDEVSAQCLTSYVHNQGTHSNCIFKFPVFSLSDGKFSLCQFT